MARRRRRRGLRRGPPAMPRAGELTTDDRYEVLAVRYGTRQASAREVFLNYHSYGEPDRPLGMDYFFWIIRNKARTVVVDTGFSAAGGAARNRTTLLSTVGALAAARVAPGCPNSAPPR